MDIDLLSKMVKELILDDDRVVLPGLGCFVAEIVPASFSDKGYTINPPYRRLYFRSRPDEGDSLIEFYAKTNNIDYAIAERILKDFLAELKSVLHARKAVVLPGLGRLRATKENNLFFVADEDLDIYPEGFGLEPISLKTHSESAEEVSAAVIGLKTMLVSDEPVIDQQPAEDIPEPAAEPEPVTEHTAEPEPVGLPEPVVEEETVPEPVVEEEMVPEPVVEEKPVAEPVPEVKKKKRSAGRTLLVVLLSFVIALVVLLVAYVLVGRLCPEWIDQFLYTPEELQILNHK